MKNVHRPLSEEELAELEDFLLSDATTDECMDISTLDGFFAALVIGPVTVMPSEWLPVVWGEAEGEEMVWESAAQAEHIMGLLMRFMNTMAMAFQEAPEEFEPLIYDREVDGKTVAIIDDWCYGFMQGVSLKFDAWKPIFKDKSAEAALLVPMLYGTEEGWKKLEEQGDSPEKHAQYVELLGPSIQGIYQFWRERRVRPVAAKSTKVGRNEPCPCGSGKKYKKCCGAASTLH